MGTKVSTEVRKPGSHGKVKHTAYTPT